MTPALRIREILEGWLLEPDSCNSHKECAKCKSPNRQDLKQVVKFLQSIKHHNLELYEVFGMLD